jgi:hypothetical protein
MIEVNFEWNKEQDDGSKFSFVAPKKWDYRGINKYI